MSLLYLCKISVTRTKIRKPKQQLWSNTQNSDPKHAKTGGQNSKTSKSKITKIEKSLNFRDFYELWRLIVPTVNICWTWNFACLFKHTRTANIRNINIFEYKMHVRRASKVCTCSDVQICFNFRMLLLGDFMSDWLEILHDCWCSLGQPLHEESRHHPGKCALHVQTNFARAKSTYFN